MPNDLRHFSRHSTVHTCVSLVAAALLASCVFAPRTTVTIDPACQGVRKRMVLDGAQVASIGGCSNQGCAVLLAGAGVVSAATFVVSGSIVVVGNIVYWIERQAGCTPPPRPPEAPAP